jgi:predicted DNA-binding protein
MTKDTMKTSLRIPMPLFKRLKQQALDTNMAATTIVISAIEKYLGDEK